MRHLLILACLPVLAMTADAPPDPSAAPSAGPALGASTPPAATAPRVRRPGWGLFNPPPVSGWYASATGAVVGAGETDAGDEVTLWESRLRLGHRRAIGPRAGVGIGQSYATRRIDAPGASGLPARVFSWEANLSGWWRVDDDVTLNLLVSPGIRSDGQDIGSDALRIPVLAVARWRASDTATGYAGVIYTGNHDVLPVLPVLGVEINPAPDWTIALTLPAPGVTWRPRPGWSLTADAGLNTGEYQLADDNADGDTIGYRDVRVRISGSWNPLRQIGFDLGGGMALARRFSWDGREDRGDLDLEPGPFIEGGVSGRW